MKERQPRLIHQRQGVVEHLVGLGGEAGDQVGAEGDIRADEMFENTLSLVEKAGLSFLHVFPFSPRPGTPAARMPQLERGVVKARAERLRGAGEAALTRHLDRQVGRTVPALVEREGLARAEDFTEIAFDGSAEAGSIAPLRITGHDGKRARAQSL